MALAPLEVAQRLYRRAHEHKLEERRQRTAARIAMAELRSICEHYGIKFELVKGGAYEHGQHETPADDRDGGARPSLR